MQSAEQKTGSWCISTAFIATTHQEGSRVSPELAWIIALTRTTRWSAGQSLHGGLNIFIKDEETPWGWDAINHGICIFLQHFSWI